MPQQSLLAAEESSLLLLASIFLVFALLLQLAFARHYISSICTVQGNWPPAPRVQTHRR